MATAQQAAKPPPGDGSGSGAAAASITCGVLLFPGFEPLDVVGPASVFGSVPGIRLVYVAAEAGPVTSVTAEMTWVAGYSFADMQPPSSADAPPAAAAPPAAGGERQQGGAPQQQQQQQQPRLDWLLVPGGVGTRPIAADPGHPVLAFLRAWAGPGAGLSLIMSVCTGSALLAAAGLLDGRRATSNKVAWQWVTGLTRAAGDRVDWVRRARWVHDGRYLTSSGVSAGTDAAVYAVKALLSPQAAAAAAKRLEHVPVVAPDEDPFADEGYMPPV